MSSLVLLFVSIGQTTGGKIMRRVLIQCVSLVVFLGFASSAAAQSCPEFLDHEQRKLHSRDSVNLCEVAAGQPMLVVNTASRCGYTGQFEGWRRCTSNIKTGAWGWSVLPVMIFARRRTPRKKRPRSAL